MISITEIVCPAPCFHIGNFELSKRESYYLSMITRIGGRRPARLYIEEWMTTVPGLDQKRLAERMKTTGGTISKKLKEPNKIDAAWLQRFADALDLEVTDLFRDPSAPTPAELLQGMSDQQRKEVLDFAAFVRQRDGTNG